MGENGTTILNILDNTIKLWMTKYIIVEIFSSGGATLYKNHSDQTVIPKFANGEADVADEPPNTELEAVAVVGGAVNADVDVAELDPKIDPVDAGVAKTDDGLDTLASTELVAKGFETAAVVIIGIGLLK